MSIVDEMRKKLNFNINNLWLGNKITDVVVIDPTTGPEDDTLTLTMRTLGITFESLYQNYASYPNTINLSNDAHIIKTYYLENDKKILIDIVTKENTQGTVIKTTISGDTELPYPLLRMKTIYGEDINTTYHEVK